MLQTSRKSRNNVTYKELEIPMALILSTATLEHRKQWNNTFKILNENDLNLEFYTESKYQSNVRVK